MFRRLRTVLLLVTGTFAPAAAGSQPPAADTAPTWKIISVGGCVLRYAIEGSGPTAVVIGSAQVYARMFSPALREKLRLVFLDDRTFAVRCNAAARDSTSVTLDTLTDEIEQALSQLRLGRTILIGHSLHGSMAVAFARRHPKRVSHVVVIGDAPFGAADDGGLANWRANASPQRKAAYAAAQARLDSLQREVPLPEDLAFIRWYAHQAAMRWHDWNHDQLTYWTGVRFRMPLAVRQAHLTRSVIASAVPLLRQPLLVVMGAHDYPVPWRNWDSLARLPHVTRRVLQRSGHNPMTEEPAEFQRILVEWLARNGNGKQSSLGVTPRGGAI